MIQNAIVHHVGIAVKSIDDVKAFYIAMGYKVTETVLEPVQKVYVAYAKKTSSPTLELLEPVDETSPVANILKKNGNTPYHICYAVSDINQAIAELRQNGFIPLSKPVPGHGLDDALMVFLFNKKFGLIQIMQQ